MKNLKAPFLVIALLFLNVLLAGPKDMPVPGDANEMNAQQARLACPNCPADFPIDQNIVFLVISGLALGATIIYKNRTKKASI
ncbi:hypothetical protein ACWA1F_15215 [Flavobacterium sp. 3-218]